MSKRNTHEVKAARRMARQAPPLPSQKEIAAAIDEAVRVVADEAATPLLYATAACGVLHSLGSRSWHLQGGTLAVRRDGVDTVVAGPDDGGRGGHIWLARRPSWVHPAEVVDVPVDQLEIADFAVPAAAVGVTLPPWCWGSPREVFTAGCLLYMADEDRTRDVERDAREVVRGSADATAIALHQLGRLSRPRALAALSPTARARWLGVA